MELFYPVLSLIGLYYVAYVIKLLFSHYHYEVIEVDNFNNIHCNSVLEDISESIVALVTEKGNVTMHFVCFTLRKLETALFLRPLGSLVLTFIYLPVLLYRTYACFMG